MDRGREFWRDGSIVLDGGWRVLTSVGMAYGPKPRPAVDRVLAKTIKTKDGCLLYTGSKRADGYGLISVGSRADGSFRLERVHRVVYEALVGPIPAGMHVHHRCGHNACVRLLHLELATPEAHAQEHAAEGLWANNGAYNAVKTHCPQGHEYSPDNTRVHGGKRHCVACQREKMREKREAETGRPTQIPVYARTHCPQGHEYDEHNTRVYRGMRYCKACRWERAQSEKKTDVPYRGPSAERTECPAGHPYDAANTGVHKDGYRFCLTCKREKNRNYMRRKAAERKAPG